MGGGDGEEGWAIIKAVCYKSLFTAGWISSPAFRTRDR